MRRKLIPSRNPRLIFGELAPARGVALDELLQVGAGLLLLTAAVAIEACEANHAAGLIAHDVEGVELAVVRTRAVSAASVHGVQEDAGACRLRQHHQSAPRAQLHEAARL